MDLTWNMDEDWL